MPIKRYFVGMGGLLLALLFIADWYFPKNASAGLPGSPKPGIRIASDHKWPERIDIDTSLPTIVPPPTVLVAAPPAARDPREAFAKVTSRLPEPQNDLKAVRTMRPRTAARARSSRIASYRPGLPTEALPAW